MHQPGSQHARTDAQAGDGQHNRHAAFVHAQPLEPVLEGVRPSLGALTQRMPPAAAAVAMVVVVVAMAVPPLPVAVPWVRLLIAIMVVVVVLVMVLRAVWAEWLKPRVRLQLGMASVGRAAALQGQAGMGPVWANAGPKWNGFGLEARIDSKV